MNYTLQDWENELKRRFGEDIGQWKFKCPACGKVSSVQEFLDLGADGNDSYQNCIGRFTGKGAPVKDSKKGCNWASYGLFGTMGKGDEIIKEDGSTVEIFAMAEVEDS